MDYIKQALLNPLLIFENIMGLGLPNEDYVYTNTVYFTFIEMLNAALPYDYYEPVINKLLVNFDITEDMLKKVDRQSHKLDGFMSIVHATRRDLLRLYAKMGSMIKDGESADLLVAEYRRLIRNLGLDSENFYPELRARQVFFSDKSLMDLSIWMCESLTTLLYNMLYHNDPEKVGRVFVYNENNHRTSPYTMEEFIKNEGKGHKKDKLHSDVKAKERRKKEQKELPIQVNKLDKESGCDLKHPEEVIDSQHKFEVKVNEYKYKLAKYLFKLNGMKLKRHLDGNTIFGLEVQNIEINKKFKKISPWFDKTEVDIDDPRFMIRFISFLFAWVIRHLNDVAEICYAMNKDGEYVEYESKMDYVKHTVKKAVSLADKIMKNENVEEDLLYFEELMMCMESSPKTKKKVLKNTENLRHNASLLCLEFKSFPSVAMYPQDVQMNTMVKLAYMVTTHDKKMKANLPFHEGYKFRKVSETKTILEELGKAIHKSHKKNPTPPMFKYFVESDPVIESQFKDVNENQNLATGIVALKYLAFIINNPDVEKRVDDII